MPFTERETESITADIERYIWSNRRPPLKLRDQIREGQRIKGYTIDLFLNRPKWDKPDEWIEETVARIKYVKSSKHWRLYWMRADLKWHAYPEKPICKTLPEALKEIDKDQFACFWG